MKTPALLVFATTLLCGCNPPAGPQATTPTGARPSGQPRSLVEARRGFDPKPSPPAQAPEPVPAPPPAIFQLVKYDSTVGKLSAYLSPDPGDGRKHPAIVWITGGDCNSIGEVWDDQPRSNDQTAASYRKAGIVMMFPSLRGGNDNPGTREGFFGEADDVLAATDYLARLDYVDTGRIYLGGHSTGGTLAMLVAESTDRYRGVFAFGPVDDVSGYGPQYCPFNFQDRKHVELRSPGYWLESVRSPLFVIEGEGGNIDPLRQMQRKTSNPLIHFHALPGFNHFNTLAPMNDLIAAKVLQDDGPKTNIAFTAEELGALPR